MIIAAGAATPDDERGAGATPAGRVSTEKRELDASECTAGGSSDKAR